jgi:hypothetical protein
MSERIDVNFDRLNKVLDTVTEAVSNMSKDREEHTKIIYELSQLMDTKTNTLTEKCNKLESNIIRIENNIIEDITMFHSQNKIVQLEFNKRIMVLENQIMLMGEAIIMLKTKHDENITVINELRPIPDKKHKWWVCY